MGLMFDIFSTTNTIPLFGVYPSLAFLTPALDVWSAIGFASFTDMDMSALRLWLYVYQLFLLLN